MIPVVTPLASALAKVTRRLVPFMFVLYVVAYLDRVNVGFAQLQMKTALSLSDAAYGLGAGLFFIPYFLFEVPSNLLLVRFGPRRWMARIMVTWGIVSAAMMFATGTKSFYALRLALGLAEAGFFPGMILYLTYWFPPQQRAAAFARFMTAIGVSLVIGGPLSGAIMTGLDRVAGFAGWQWLFLLEGLPAVVLGFVVLAFLPDRPDDVSWLSADEKGALAVALRAPPDGQGARERHTLRHALADGRVWLLASIYFIFAMGLYGLTLWVPQLLRDLSGGSTFEVGLLAAVPYLAAVLFMVPCAKYTDRTGNYRRTLGIATAVAGAALAATACLLDVSPWLTVVALSVGVMGLFAAFGVFWALPSAFLRGTAAAGGIAVINSLGNLGGFVSPWLVGFVKERMGSFAGGVGLVAGMLLLAAALIAVGTRGHDSVVHRAS